MNGLTLSELKPIWPGGDELVIETHHRCSLMKPKPFSSFLSRHNHFHLPRYPVMAQTRTSSDSTQPEQQQHPPRNLTLTGEDSRVQRAWTHWNNLGRPKLIVAPMVDNSELPFRMLCRKYGDQAAYTPLVRYLWFLQLLK